METIIIRNTNTNTDTEAVSNTLPWYDRIANSIADSVADHLSDRAELKEAAKLMAPSIELARKARSRARAIAWARSQGFDLKYED